MRNRQILNHTLSLTSLQELMGELVTSPLENGSMREASAVGRDVREIAFELIKPSEKMTSFERLEVYNQQYWYRVLDSLKDDFPGLNALLGDQAFEELCVSYLGEHRSASFTLRNLGSSLPEFIKRKKHPGPRRWKVCFDMAAFEWAQVIAFDAEEIKPVGLSDLAADPLALELCLQPYISLLQLDYNVDEFLGQVKEEQSANSMQSARLRPNKVEESKSPGAKPARRLSYLVVHRLDNCVYIKHIDVLSFKILSAISTVCSLSAVGELTERFAREQTEEQIATTFQTNFALWAKLKWLCKAPNSK